MKAFFSTLAAILCAAAIIGGVMSHNKSEQAKRETDLKIIKLSAETSAYYSNYVIEDRVPDYVFQAADELSIKSIVTTMQQKRVTVTDVSSELRNIVYNYRDLTTYVRKKYPDKIDWADKLDSQIDALEKLMKEN